MKKINSISDFKKAKRNTKIKILLLQLSLVVVILLGWELLTRFNIIDSFFLQSPSKIFTLLVEYIKSNEIFHHIYQTTLEATLGLIISIGGGNFLATLLYLFPLLSKVLDPFLVLLNALPKSAIAPIIIIWLGTGVKGIIGVCVSFVLILTTINVLNHFNNVDQSLVIMMKTLGANKFQILTKVIFPSNVINIISTIKVGIGLSWVGVVVGEFLSSRSGLGYLIMYGGQVFKLDLVMMGIFILSSIAFLMYGIVVIIEKILSKKYLFE